AVKLVRFRGTRSVPVVTQAVGAPDGPVDVTARAVGPTPTGTGGRGRRVARVMGVTVPEPRSATRAVAPSGEMARASGSEPTGMGGPAVMVVRSTGVTEAPSRSATRAVRPLGPPMTTA